MSYLTPCYTDFTAEEIEQILKSSSGMPSALDELSGKVMSLTERVENNEHIFATFKEYVEEKINDLIEFSACTERDILEIRQYISEINEKINEISGKISDYEIVSCPEPASGDQYTYKLVKVGDPDMTPQGELIHVPLCKFTDIYKSYLDSLMKPVLKVGTVDVLNSKMPEFGYVVPITPPFGNQIVRSVSLTYQEFPENIDGNVSIYMKRPDDSEPTLIKEIPSEFIPAAGSERLYQLPQDTVIKGEESILFYAEATDKLGRRVVGEFNLTRVSSYPCYLSSSGSVSPITSGQMEFESSAVIEGDKCVIENNNTEFRDYLWLYVPVGYSLKWAFLFKEDEQTENIDGFEEMDYEFDVAFSYEGEIRRVPYKVYRTDVGQIDYNFKLYLMFAMHGEIYYGSTSGATLTMEDDLNVAFVTKDNDAVVTIQNQNREYIWLCVSYEKSITMIRQNIVYNVTNDFEIIEVPETKYGRLKCYRSKSRQKAGYKEMKVVMK